MAGYYLVRGDDRRNELEVDLGFPTYERLFAAARSLGAVLLTRCGDFHGMDEFSPAELPELRREIARVRSCASLAADVVEFLDGLERVVLHAESRGKPVIADAD